MILQLRRDLAQRPVGDATRARQRQLVSEAALRAFGDLGPWADAALGRDVEWCHGDLHAGNILVDPSDGRVTAVLDWEWYSVTCRSLDQVRLWVSAARQGAWWWARKAAGPPSVTALIAAFGVSFYSYDTGARPAVSKDLRRLASAAATAAVG